MPERHHIRTGTNGDGGSDTGKGMFAVLSRALTSILSSRASLASLAGTTFDGARDMYATLGYPRTITREMYRHMYERGGTATRLINLFPQSAWSGGGPDVFEVEDPEVLTPFEEMVREPRGEDARPFPARLQLWERFKEAHTYANRDQYSILLIGGPGDLDTPLPDGTGDPDPILYLRCYDQDAAKIDATVGDRAEDIYNPRFGKPEFYTVDLGRSPTSQDTRIVTLLTSRRVHWSRVIHISRGDGLYGTPLLQAAWNRFIDLEKLVGGGSEAAWQLMDPGMHFDVDPAVILGEEERADLHEEAEDFRNKMQRLLVTQGVTAQRMSGTAAQFGPNVTSCMEQIAGTYGVPLRKLFGSDLGLRGSEENSESYDDLITELRDGDCSRWVRDFFDRLITYNYLPRPAAGYTIEWPKREELTEAEKPDVVVKLANANKAHWEATGEVILDTNEIREIAGRKPREGETGQGSGQRQEDDGEDDDEDEDGDGAAFPRAASSRSRSRSLASAPEWRAVHRVADSHAPLVKRALRSAWKDAGAAVDDDIFATTVERGDPESAFQLVNARLGEADDALRGEMGARYSLIFEGVAATVLRSARARGTWYTSAPAQPSRPRQLRDTQADFSTQFEVTNPRALEWIRLHAAELVTEVGQETRYAIRSLIYQGVQEGVPPRELMRQVREVVGLRSDQLQAVENLRVRLFVGKPGHVVKAGKRNIKIPAGGASKDFIEANAAKYARKLLNDRALLISRTECLPGDTIVDSAVVRAVHRRFYQGDMVEIQTRAGRKFSATPNHPMLTKRGWQGAGQVRVGDYLLCDSGQQNSRAARDEHITASPSTIREIFDSLQTVGITERRRTRKPDFHGDGLEGEVDIAHPFRLLSLGNFASIRQPFIDKIFSPPDLAALRVCNLCNRLLAVNQSLCFCVGALNNPLISEGSIHDAVVGAQRAGNAMDALASLVTSHDLDSIYVTSEVGRLAPTAVEVISRLTEASAFYASLGENGANPLRIGGHFLRNSIDAEAREIELDDVVAITVRSFSGHVYNLSTPYGYFTANGGLYTGNTLAGSNAGQRELWRQAIEQGQLPSTIKRVWIVTADDRLRDEHAAVEGETVGIEEGFSIGEPGSFPNCILPGAQVSGTFVAGLKTLYSGPAVEIKTRSGYTLSLTANHPVLTSDGWRGAGKLRKGNYLISYCGEVRQPPVLDPDNQNRPVLVEKVFDAMALGGFTVEESRSHYLHGDAAFTYGQIEIVRTDSELLNYRQSAPAQEGGKLVLPFSNPAKTFLGGPSALDLPAKRIGIASPPGPSAAALSNNGGTVGLESAPFQEFRFGSASNWDLVKPEPAGENVSQDAAFIRELLHRYTGEVALDEIIEVRNFHFLGHVYDLQTMTGWMLAQGIVISNCRCSHGIVES